MGTAAQPLSLEKCSEELASWHWGTGETSDGQGSYFCAVRNMPGRHLWLQALRWTGLAAGLPSWMI